MARSPSVLRLCLLALLLIASSALPGPVSALLAPGLLVQAAEAATNPFRVEARGPTLAPSGKGNLEIRLIVPPGHHVYQDMILVNGVNGGGLVLGQPSLPPGLMKPDPANPAQQREVYDLDVIIEVPVTAPNKAGSYEASFQVSYQGCRGGLCFMPVTEDLSVKVQVEPPKPAGSKSGFVYPPFGGDVAWVSAGGGAGAAAPARAPKVDFSALPPSADVRPPGQPDRAHPVRARLLTDKEGLRPGDTFRLGLHLEQDPGWHTYWKAPGDIGLPTDISWALPAGAESTAYQYPVPERFETQGIVSYGYNEQVLLFTEVSLPESLPPGSHTLGATASWLVCEVVCIPGSAELSLPVEILAEEAQEPRLSPQAPLFDWFAARHPSSPTEVGPLGVEAAISVQAVRPEEPFKVAFLLSPTTDAPIEWQTHEGQKTWPAFTPIARGSWMVNDVQLKKTEQGGLLVVIDAETFEADPLPASDKVGGLFQVSVGGKPVVTEVMLDLPWTAPGSPVAASTSPLFTLAAGGDAQMAATPVAAAPEAPPAAPKETRSFALMLVLAFVGGAILNIMPCVLPVLTLKLYSLVSQASGEQAEQKRAGLAYTAGIVLSFLVLAAIVVILKAVFGTGVGWGFQFQYPAYVAVVATIVFAFGLSLFGVFEIPAIGANKAAQASQKEGLLGYFLSGVFTTLLATPCSAPFLGTGMGFAFSLPAWGVLLFFAVAGLGLASPFLVIAFVPGAMRFLPRPGAWMETFKHLMGFTLIATTIWLVDVLAAQVGRDGVIGFLAFLLAVGVGAWIYGRFGGPTEPVRRQAGSFAVGALLSLLVFWRFVDLSFAEDCEPDGALTTASGALDFSGEIPWQAFSDQRVDELSGQTVFVDFTADWCLTCKVNERTVLETDTVREGMVEHGVVPLKADWTRKDETITRWLQRFGRAGVPFYLVIPADRSRDPIPLGEVITPSAVVEAMQAAGS